ncbi:MAG: ClbS/DfsB family four-helix bundle protein [Bacteroidia bacterium]|nr:ClbS/DfsB family four-helix bundle protein [Bacteroidia bacterium]NND52120.1 ClbS/DfsB family four-helix bundle protein [Flavobacteriaceae bacterium]
MPVPKTKEELIQQSRDNYHRLNSLIDSFSSEEQKSDFPKGTMNRNIRDVIAHLHHWHKMFIDWYTVGMTGEKPDMPAKGYSWKDTKALNQKIWADYQNHNLESIRKDFEASYKELQKIIQSHTDEELFEKKRYKWTGSSSLGTYLRANTSSHYNWGYNLIKRAKK